MIPPTPHFQRPNPQAGAGGQPLLRQRRAPALAVRAGAPARRGQLVRHGRHERPRGPGGGAAHPPGRPVQPWQLLVLSAASEAGPGGDDGPPGGSPGPASRSWTSPTWPSPSRPGGGSWRTGGCWSAGAWPRPAKRWPPAIPEGLSGVDEDQTAIRSPSPCVLSPWKPWDGAGWREPRWTGTPSTRASGGCGSPLPHLPLPAPALLDRSAGVRAAAGGSPSSSLQAKAAPAHPGRRLRAAPQRPGAADRRPLRGSPRHRARGGLRPVLRDGRPLAPRPPAPLPGEERDGRGGAARMAVPGLVGGGPRGADRLIRGGEGQHRTDGHAIGRHPPRTPRRRPPALLRPGAALVPRPPRPGDDHLQPERVRAPHRPPRRARPRPALSPRSSAGTSRCAPPSWTSTAAPCSASCRPWTSPCRWSTSRALPAERREAEAERLATRAERPPVRPLPAASPGGRAVPPGPGPPRARARLPPHRGGRLVQRRPPLGAGGDLPRLRRRRALAAARAAASSTRTSRSGSAPGSREEEMARQLAGVARAARPAPARARPAHGPAAARGPDLPRE